MKKLKLLTAILIIFIGMCYLTKAQVPDNCPTGYTMLTDNIPVTENGITCFYQIFLCVKCQVGTYPGTILTEIMVHALRPIDENCQLDPDVVMNAIVEKINDINWLARFINNCGNGWPPCANGGENFTQIDYYYPKCWKWEYIITNEQPPYEYDIIKAAGCSCFCHWSKKYCWDLNHSNLIQIGSTINYPSECETCSDSLTCWSEPCPTIE